MWLLGPQDDGSSLLTLFLRLSGIVSAVLLMHAFRKGYQVRKKFQALKDEGIVCHSNSRVGPWSNME
jgi:hypothetical protein